MSSKELLGAYETIMLLSMKGNITREEHNARIVALRDSPLAKGLTFKQRDALATKAAKRAAEIIDEVYFSESGTWQ